MVAFSVDAFVLLPILFVELSRGSLVIFISYHSTPLANCIM